MDPDVILHDHYRFFQGEALPAKLPQRMSITNHSGGNPIRGGSRTGDQAVCDQLVAVEVLPPYAFVYNDVLQMGIVLEKGLAPLLLNGNHPLLERTFAGVRESVPYCYVFIVLRHRAIVTLPSALVVD